MRNEEGLVSNMGEWILPKRLRRGIREALDAGRGQLRMDPEDLAELIGKAIDMEIERLQRIREERERRHRVKMLLHSAEDFFVTRGGGPKPQSTSKFEHPVEWARD